MSNYDIATFEQTYHALENDPLAIGEDTIIMWEVQIPDLVEAASSDAIRTLYSVHRDTDGRFALLLVGNSTESSAPFALESVDLTTDFPTAPYAVLSETQIQNMLRREAEMFDYSTLAEDLRDAGYQASAVDPQPPLARPATPTL